MKNNNNILVILVIILSILVLALGGYLIYDKVLNTNDINNNDIQNNDINDNNKPGENNINYNVNDYITLVDEEIKGSKFKKISFKNLDTNLTYDFLNDQENLISKFKNITSVYTLTYQSEFWYQINKNILTVYFNLQVSDEMCEKSPSIVVTNIDLLNKKIITDKELLEIANTSFNKIATDSYNKSLDSIRKCNKTKGMCALLDKNGNKITIDKYTTNKNNYIKTIEDSLDDIIFCYIENGNIKYDYYDYAIDGLYLDVSKGGCFEYVTVEVGKI